jgi:nitroreductase
MADPVLAVRRPDHPVEPLLVRRWSPRAMSGEPLRREELERLLEAARWAPSSYNAQPWRFCWAARDTPHWPRFFELLSENNRRWCQRAAVLMVVVSRTVLDNGQPARTSSYDAGAAWENLALQGTAMGLVVHGMQGFDYDRAREALNVPAEFKVEAMIAVGRPGPVENLPEPLRERERPSLRRPVAEIALEGGF